MMGLLQAVLVGFVAGLLAGWLSPGRRPAGCLMTIVLGIAGAVFATWAGRWMGIYGSGQQAGLIAAVIGAMALLGLGRMFSR
jgi:uncharacterized membrane protein YeaQ/YmgE (transglycosylase-associated protein family)